MIRRDWIRASASLAITLAIWFLVASPLSANSVRFSGALLAGPYILRDGSIFVALDDVADALGLSVLDDGDRILIGGTIHGTLIVDPDSASLTISGRTIDCEYAMVREGDRWYAPDRFLNLALGVETRLSREGGELSLYPIVVAITESESAVRITSSVPPNFQTFELSDPPRRVIDVENAVLACRGIEVPGSELGLDGVAEIRASQFNDDPPTVRVVLEWEGENPPSHTLFPEDRNLTVLVGSGTAGVAGSMEINLLDRALEVTSQPQVSAPRGTEPDDTQQPGLGPDVGDSPPELDPPDEGRQDQSPPDIIQEFPEGAEDLPLNELGWDVSFEMGADGELVATITTPPYERLSQFTLTGDGMRLVIDLLGTYIPGHERRLDGLGEIQRIRFAQFQPAVTRIVFDLDRVRAYRIEERPDDHLIVVRLLSGDLTGKTIVIDPGHGGEDPGAVVRGLMEKDLNLEMAFMLRDFLEEHGAEIILTRETDVYVTLARRIEIAVGNDADLFVCIHNNATEEPTVIQGSLLLYNNPDYMNLYRQVHRGIAARTGVPGLGPVPDERGLYILRHAGDMPVVFLEGAFMTNAIDFARLTDRSRAYSYNIMAGVMDGLLAYYTGRDLDPVVMPDYGDAIETGVFDLAGRPLVLPGLVGEGHDLESDDGWDTPDEADDSAGQDSDDSDDEAGTDDEDDEEEEGYHRVRGRGGYRYR